MRRNTQDYIITLRCDACGVEAEGVMFVNRGVAVLFRCRDCEPDVHARLLRDARVDR